MNNFSACSIFTCDGATLSGGRWETLTFMFTLDCAMYTDMWTGYTKYVRYVRWSVCTDIVADVHVISLQFQEPVPSHL